MNPGAAKNIGYEMQDNEIHMNEKWNLDIKERYNNLHHELEEMGLIEKGDLYWQAHMKALENEDNTDLSSLELPAKRNQPYLDEMVTSRRSSRNWWDDNFYSTPQQDKTVGNRYYRGRRILPPNLGGEI
jgi:hypothetical protein